MEKSQIIEKELIHGRNNNCIRNQAALIKKLQDEKKAKKELREEGESIEGEKLFLQD